MPDAVVAQSNRWAAPSALVERFGKFVRFHPSGCAEWVGFRNRKGYGTFKFAGISLGAYRVAYFMWKGFVPVGYQIDHLCRNRACVNPEHLEAVLPRTNTIRGKTLAADQLKRTHCPRGHAYAGENLRLSNGGRRRH